MLKNKKGAKKEESSEAITEALWRAYRDKVIPIEERYKFSEMYGAPFGEGDFTAKPMVLLVGQYSTGKTTFIRYILDEDFPGIRIGPEPTTDNFTVIMYGEDKQVIPGNVATLDQKLQFRPLSMFGNQFLSHFNCVFTNNPVLQGFTLIDTPGILSGEKQRVNRGYDFDRVLGWFAERVDKIIILFDAHKLDISDELSSAIHAIKERHNKIIVVLNKADGMQNQELLRVYGSLMWSLAKVISTPEVLRVYIGSFWDRPLRYAENKRLFELEQDDLFAILEKLQKTCMIRKFDDTCRRASGVKIHCCTLAEIKGSLPMLIGKQKTLNEKINKIGDTYDIVSKKYGLPRGDFPPVVPMKKFLENLDFSKIEPYKSHLFGPLDTFLSKDLPALMKKFQQEQESDVSITCSQIKGGVFNGVETPFSNVYDGINRGKYGPQWAVEEYRDKWSKDFYSLSLTDGKLHGQTAAAHLGSLGTKTSVLKKIWNLSDVDKDGCLNLEEYLLARYLIDLQLQETAIPEKLPDHLLPPSYRESASTVSGEMAGEHELAY